jgi:hypothetical protein
MPFFEPLDINLILKKVFMTVLNDLFIFMYYFFSKNDTIA